MGALFLQISVEFLRNWSISLSLSPLWNMNKIRRITVSWARGGVMSGSIGMEGGGDQEGCVCTWWQRSPWLLTHTENLEGTARTHQSSNSSSSALHFSPSEVSLQAHPVDDTFIFLGPVRGWHYRAAYCHPLTTLQWKLVSQISRESLLSYHFLHCILT